MAKNPKLVVDDRYEEAAMEFLRVMALELDLALKEAEITDVKKRRKVVDTFCFGMGNFLDQYWFAVEGTKYFPVVCFADRHREDNPATLAAPEFFSYHEYALDTFDSVTNKGKGPYAIQIGLVGDEEPMTAEELEE